MSDKFNWVCACGSRQWDGANFCPLCGKPQSEAVTKVEETGKPPWQVRHYHLGERGPYGDFGISVRYRYEDDEESGVLRIDYEIYHVLGISGTEGKGAVLYQEDGAQSSPTPTEDISNAQKTLHGFIKRDGCQQFWMDDEPIHVDDARTLDQLGACLKLPRELAAEIMADRWEG